MFEIQHADSSVTMYKLTHEHSFFPHNYLQHAYQQEKWSIVPHSGLLMGAQFFLINAG